MAEGIAFSFLRKISEYLGASIGQLFGYVFHYNGNIEKMRRKVEELEAKSRGVKLLVEAGNNNCEVIAPEVELWLKRVKEKMEEANLILSDEEKVGRGCLNEGCLHFKLRYSVSRKATERTQDLVEFIIAAGNFTMVTCPGPPLANVPKSSEDKNKTQPADEVQVDGPLVPDLAIASTSSSSFGELESRLAIMRNVMEAIRDDNIRNIGICGMGGVGKTTMVHEVDRIAREESLFDEIATVVVSQEPDVTRIQRGIAAFLKLELEEPILARASRLHERLSQKGPNDKPKRILIILDDLWKRLDLKEVGIPFGDDHSGCKLVLTSRSRDVCFHMKADKIFSIPVLPENEAWILFKDSLRTTNLYPVAQEIVKECGGLPIAITTIARVLAEKEEDTWNYVRRQLKRSSLEGEYGEEVYNVFKVSYDNLKSKEIKDVFLLCCLFHEDFDIPIEALTRFGMGRRFFKTADKLHEARENVHAHAQVLKSLNLLLHSEKEECVKMHDLVRDFGLSIASEGEFFVRFDKGLKEWPMEDRCEQYTSISMQCDEMVELPNELKYPNLKLLQMWGSNFHPWLKFGSNSSDFKFPERLDEVMGELQVLALTCISIPSLPESVERLSNLRTLSLSGCKLNDVSRIGNIEKLEILSFVDSDISELPREIGKLSRLRLLDLTGCWKLQKIAPGVLSKLVRLEELYMGGTFIRWAEEIRATLNGDEDEEEVGDDEEEAGDDEETYASLGELKQLSNLEKFKIYIEGTAESELYIKHWKLLHISQNTLLLVGDEIAPLKCLLEALCRKTEFMYVRVKDLKNLCNEVERKDSRRLKTLIFRSCDELVSVFDDGMDQSSNIHSSSLVLPAFGNLRHLLLYDCSKLKSVFSLSIARGLINLETLEISMCSGIEEFISKERGDNEDEKKAVEFLCLKKMELYDLPNLVSFCKAAVDEVKFPKLKKMKLEKLPKLTSIYHAYAAASSSSTNHPFFHQKVTSTSLEKLNVIYCDSLRHLFTPSMAKTLVSLEKILVNCCEVLEAIVAAEDGEEDEKEFTTEEAVLFPKLTRLYFWNLPSLLTVLPKPYCFNRSSLKQITLEEKIRGSRSRRPPKQICLSTACILNSQELMTIIQQDAIRYKRIVGWGLYGMQDINLILQCCRFIGNVEITYTITGMNLKYQCLGEWKGT